MCGDSAARSIRYSFSWDAVIFWLKAYKLPAAVFLGGWKSSAARSGFTSENQKSPNSTAQPGDSLRAKIGNPQTLLLRQVIHYERKSEIPKFYCSDRRFATSENRKSPNSTAQSGDSLRAKIRNPQILLLSQATYYERKSEIPKFYC